MLLLSRDVSLGVRFYGNEGIGLPVKFVSEEYAEFDTGSATSLAIQLVDREADSTTGYSPFLNFDVDDMDSLIPKLMMAGGRLDGPVKYPLTGKVATVRSPDGHMVGLFEKNSE